MSNNRPLEERYLDLLGQLFNSLGYQSHSTSKFDSIAPDLFLTNPENMKAIVEAKLYRTEFVGRNILRRAAYQAERVRRTLEADWCILAVTSRVDEVRIAELRPNPSLVIYDYDVLSAFFREYTQLTDEFESLLDQAFPFRSEFQARPRPITFKQLENLKNLKAQQGSTSVPITIDFEKGKELFDALEAVPVGKEGAVEFERLCSKCLEYVFEDELIFLGKQTQSDTGLHRFDCITKIRSTSDFWLSLVRDFRSRYVIFEFKNYKEAISQKEVYSTEKYLFPLAMRGIAILIARNGANDNAKAIARGALRENGKLIILISNCELKQLLDRKDRGDDPSDVIADAIDEMLIGLER